MLPPRPRRRRILGLAVPIIGGMISQNLLNLVDTAFVSQLGDLALAAVGIANFVHFVSIAFITGLAAGVQATAARRKGEGRDDETAVPLNGGLLLAVGFGIPIALVVWELAPWLLPTLANDDAEVGRVGAAYLQLRLLAAPAVGMNFAFRGFWNAVDLSRIYLRTIVVMHLINAVLDYGLIFGAFGLPEMGVEGAALASTIATTTGALLYSAQGWARAREAGFLRGVPSARVMASMLRTSLPAGLQTFFFAAGMTVFFSIVARLGRAELAASNVLINLLLVAVLPALGFGLAAASLVGQGLGARDVSGARRWGWDVVRTAVPLVALITVPGLVLPDLVLGVFLHDPDTLALARAPLRLLAVTLPIDAVGTVLMNALLGSGDSRRVLIVATSLQWLLFLPLAWLVGPVLGWGLFAVFCAQGLYRLVQTGVFAGIWTGSAWARVEV
ncbi:MAG: MATE family efflux transporter [Sandaracinaceae bacterium]